MNKNEWPVVPVRELMAALRCCATNTNQGGGCGNCPMEGKVGRLECAELICLMAAEELRKLLDATEGICQREVHEMVRLAKECNTALERGLAKVSEETFRKMLEHQERLTQLGRESFLQAEPAKGYGWRVDGIQVEGAVVFDASAEHSAEEAGKDAEDG